MRERLREPLLAIPTPEPRRRGIRITPTIPRQSTIAVASGTQADLSVTNSGSPNPVTAGNNITYTQTVTNGGPATANAPVIHRNAAGEYHGGITHRACGMDLRSGAR